MGIGIGITALAIWLIIKYINKPKNKTLKVSLPYNNYNQNRDYLQDLAVDITIDNGNDLDAKLHLFQHLYKGDRMLEFDVNWITSIAITQLKNKPKTDSSFIRIIPSQLK